MVNASVVTGKAVRIAKPPHTVMRLIARVSALKMLMHVIPMMRCVLMVIARSVSFFDIENILREVFILNHHYVSKLILILLYFQIHYARLRKIENGTQDITSTTQFPGFLMLLIVADFVKRTQYVWVPVILWAKI